MSNMTLAKDEVAETPCTEETCSFFGKGVCEKSCKEPKEISVPNPGETNGK